MPCYQAYLANENGKMLRSPEVFLASDDVAAVEQARAEVGVPSCGRDAAA
jgi:hypothetical protein